MRTSIFDIFKIGIGPSSSHTVGPMRAAERFVTRLATDNQLSRVERLQAELFGSLALTGIGHGTDRAVLLGLTGEKPEEVNPDTVESTLAQIRSTQQLRAAGQHWVRFCESRDLLFHSSQVLPGHSNGLRFSAYTPADELVATATFYSIGGGFIREEGQSLSQADRILPVPHPFSSGAELLEKAQALKLGIAELMLANEAALAGSPETVRLKLRHIWTIMDASIERGLATSGILPGGLNVRRRAPRLWQKIANSPADDPLRSMDLVNVFAMAVNEENAAGGRVVTAPTNGAAGLLPAVARYYRTSLPEATEEGLDRFLLTAGAIGILYKENASISGAEVGCQGEVGVACSMAAAGLAGALGGSPEEVEHAAEIGMEHHLGMTCDPIGGLVQIPCIERNAIGAVKAINACRMALADSGGHKVSLDQVIQTMYQTGLDMQSRYKETALAGLAVNVKDC
jgi:L-serine dehydratase